MYFLGDVLFRWFVSVICIIVSVLVLRVVRGGLVLWLRFFLLWKGWVFLVFKSFGLWGLVIDVDCILMKVDILKICIYLCKNMYSFCVYSSIFLWKRIIF